VAGELHQITQEGKGYRCQPLDFDEDGHPTNPSIQTLQRKTAEAQLLRTQRLRALAHLLRGIAHDSTIY